MSFFQDPFLLLISLILVSVIFVPFGIFGLLKFREWFTGWLKVRSGYIRVRQRLPNGRWRIFWARPSGKKISIKDEETGRNQDVPITLETGFEGYEGSTPFIEIDENLQQMPLTRTQITIPKEHSTRMSYLAYLAGKIAGMKEESMLHWLLIVAICVMIGAAAFMLWNMNSIKGQIAALTAKIAAIPLFNQTQPYYPPQVG